MFVTMKIKYFGEPEERAVPRDPEGREYGRYHYLGRLWLSTQQSKAKPTQYNCGPLFQCLGLRLSPL
jgi:hypothetical protein